MCSCETRNGCFSVSQLINWDKYILFDLRIASARHNLESGYGSDPAGFWIVSRREVENEIDC